MDEPILTLYTTDVRAVISWHWCQERRILHLPCISCKHRSAGATLKRLRALGFYCSEQSNCNSAPQVLLKLTLSKQSLVFDVPVFFLNSSLPSLLRERCCQEWFKLSHRFLFLLKLETLIYSLVFEGRGGATKRRLAFDMSDACFCAGFGKLKRGLEWSPPPLFADRQGAPAPGSVMNHRRQPLLWVWLRGGGGAVWCWSWSRAARADSPWCCDVASTCGAKEKLAQSQQIIFIIKLFFVLLLMICRRWRDFHLVTWEFGMRAFIVHPRLPWSASKEQEVTIVFHHMMTMQHFFIQCLYICVFCVFYMVLSWKENNIKNYPLCLICVQSLILHDYMCFYYKGRLIQRALVAQFAEGGCVQKNGEYKVVKPELFVR